MTDASSMSSSSSLSSSSDDRREFRELAYAVDEARQCYSDTTREVGQLERYLEAIRMVLEASKRETTATQVMAADA